MWKGEAERVRATLPPGCNAVVQPQGLGQGPGPRESQAVLERPGRTPLTLHLNADYVRAGPDHRNLSGRPVERFPRCTSWPDNSAWTGLPHTSRRTRAVLGLPRQLEKPLIRILFDKIKGAMQGTFGRGEV